MKRLLLRARGWWADRTGAWEQCHDCRRRIGAFTGSYWWADDDLWREVIGGDFGVYCPPCFTARCAEHGLVVYWAPVVARSERKAYELSGEAA